MEIDIANETLLQSKPRHANQRSVVIPPPENTAELRELTAPQQGNSLAGNLSPCPPAPFSLSLTVRTSVPESPVISKSSLSVAEFVRRWFIPQHVEAKRSAGKSHFHAILKHILPPEEVDRVTRRAGEEDRTKLVSIPDWPYIGGLKLSEVGAQSVQRLLQAALHHGFSVLTVTHIRNVVRAIFSHAVKTGHHSGDNPASLVSLPVMSRRESPTLTLSQVGYLLHAMCYPERDLALLIMLTDLSVGEICGLQWKYVNLAKSSQAFEGEVIPPSTIAVRWQQYRGKLNRVLGGRKRFVRSPAPAALLLQYLRNRPQFTQPEDFVLVTRKGTPISPENIAARRLKAVGKPFGMEWLSWSAFHRSGVRIRAELGRSFDEELGRLVSGVKLKP